MSEVLLSSKQLLVARLWSQEIVQSPIHFPPFRGRAPGLALCVCFHPFALSGERVFEVLEYFVTESSHIPQPARDTLSAHSSGYWSPFWTICVVSTYQADILGMIPAYSLPPVDIPLLATNLVLSSAIDRDNPLHLDLMLP